MNSPFNIASARGEKFFAALAFALLYLFVGLLSPAQATPQRITDKAGNLVWAAAYDAYGKATVQTSASATLALSSHLRYPGQYFDGETGLHYNDRRYYDPDTGRYASRDPIGFEGGINLYTYAGAAPSRYTDPTGEIIPCMVANYLRCNLICNAEAAAMDMLKCGEVNWGDNAKDCLKDCLWSMLPLPDPCGKFGKLFGAATGAAAGLNSFTGDTLVHVRPQGANAIDALKGKTEKRAIKDLQPGDEVLAYAEWKDKGTSLTDDGQRLDERLSYQKVQEVMITQDRVRTLVHLSLSDGQKITTTDGHPFKTLDGWRDAILLKKGGKLLLKGGEGDSDHLATIDEVRTEQITVKTFNLEVANAHTFFVGDEGVLVHNGFVYCRTAPGRKPYVGKSDDLKNYRHRQNSHDRKYGTEHDYDVLYEGPETDKALEKIEQKFLDKFGGPTNKGNPNGGTENRRNNIRKK